MSKPIEVLWFIDHFTENDDSNDVKTTFTQGCCYWFAYILKGRFPDAEIMYHPIENHFVTQIGDYLYDVRGAVTDLYNDEKLVKWDEYPDELEKLRIIRDCINF